MVIKNQGIKSTIVLYIGAFLGSLLTIFLFPKFMTADQIGLVKLFDTIAILLLPLSTLGLANAVVRFYPRFKADTKKAAAFVFGIFTFVCLASITVTLVYFKFGYLLLNFLEIDNPLFLDHEILLAPLFLIFAMQAVVEALCKVHYKLVIPRIFKDIVLRLFKIGLLLLFALMAFGIGHFLILYIAAQTIILCSLLIYLFVFLKQRLYISRFILNEKVIKPLSAFSSTTMLQAMGGSLSVRIDVLMVTGLIGLDALGIYSTGMFIGMVTEMPRRAITQISMPIISQAFKDRQINKIKSIYKKSSINQFLVGGFMFSLIWANIDLLYAVMPQSEVFSAGKYVVLFIGLSKVFDMLMGTNNEIISMSKYYYLNLILVLCLAFLNYFMNKWLIPDFGITGAAMATALSILIYNTVRFSIVAILLKMSPFTTTLFFSISVILGLNLGLYFGIVIDNLWIASIMKSVTIVICFFSLIWFGNVSPDLKALINLDALRKLFLGK